MTSGFSRPHSLIAASYRLIVASSLNLLALIHAKMSAPSSDPPQDPPQTPSNTAPKDSSSINANVEASENEPLLGNEAESASGSGTGDDVAMEDTAPKTKEDTFEDIPEGVMSVSPSSLRPRLAAP